MFSRMTSAQVTMLREAVNRNNRLFKAGVSLGQPLADQIAGGGPFSGALSPLVPQSLDKTWSSETFDKEHIILTNMLASKDASQSQHEVVVVTDYGNDRIPGFVAEGKVPATETASIDRRIVDVKYLSVRREITQQAMAAKILGGSNPGGSPMVSASGLAFETSAGMRSLVKKYEEAMFRADSSIYSYEFDGIKKQIMDTGVVGRNVIDKRGAVLTLQNLVEDIARLQDRPTFAKIDSVLVPHTVWSGMAAAVSNSNGLYDMTAESSRVFFNKDDLMLRMPGNRQIRIKVAPLMNADENPPDNIAGNSLGTTPTPSITNGANDSAPLFTGTWDGKTYRYKAVLQYDNGYANVSTDASNAPPDTQSVIVTVSMAGLNPRPLWVDFYRSTPDGAASTCKYVTRVKVPASGDVVFTDTNAILPGASDAYALQTDKDAMYEARLLGTVRFPLAPLELAQPFAIARFSSPHVVHRLRQIVYLNCSQTGASMVPA